MHAAAGLACTAFLAVAITSAAATATTLTVCLFYGIIHHCQLATPEHGCQQQQQQQEPQQHPLEGCSGQAGTNFGSTNPLSSFNRYFSVIGYISDFECLSVVCPRAER